jgi:uncharacterized protein
MTAKPIPQPTTDTVEFWQACNQGKLLIQQCDVCERKQHYPRPFCIHCQSERVRWVETSGRGSIYSVTTVHRSANPAFDADIPYVIALIELDEGVRMMMNLIGPKRHIARVGDRVRIHYEQRSPEQKIPQATLESGV